MPLLTFGPDEFGELLDAIEDNHRPVLGFRFNQFGEKLPHRIIQANRDTHDGMRVLYLWMNNWFHTSPDAIGMKWVFRAGGSFQISSPGWRLVVDEMNDGLGYVMESRDNYPWYEDDKGFKREQIASTVVGSIDAASSR